MEGTASSRCAERRIVPAGREASSLAGLEETAPRQKERHDRDPLKRRLSRRGWLRKDALVWPLHVCSLPSSIVRVQSSRPQVFILRARWDSCAVQLELLCGGARWHRRQGCTAGPFRRATEAGPAGEGVGSAVPAGVPTTGVPAATLPQGRAGLVLAELCHPSRLHSSTSASACGLSNI